MRDLASVILEKRKPPICRCSSGASFCAPGETRTPNLLIRSQMLYPLSYGRRVLLFSCARLPGRGGGERI